MLEISAIISLVLNIIWKIIAWTWWIVLVVFLAKKFGKYWIGYVHFKYYNSVKYKLLELKIPKDNIKTPKSMENIFSAFHATRAFVSSLDKKYIKGETQLWLSLEVVGDREGASFYVRTPGSFQNLVEAQIYAQYPDAEIVEREDYILDLPKNLPDKNFDVWGADMILAKDSAYPIKTYEYFEEQKEEKRIDPMASLLEVMSKLKDQERIWFQILIKYTGDDWKKKADETISDLAGKKKKPKDPGFFDYLGEFITGLVKAPVAPPEFSFGKSGDSDSPESRMLHLTSGEKDVIKAIEQKISKLGFETLVRFIYIDKRDTFSRQNINGIFGALLQFNTQNLNAFKPCPETLPSAKPPYKARKEFLKKRLLYGAYRLRLLNPYNKSVLNTEELATMFHFPIMAVDAPLLKRIGAKKGEPPVDLPIESKV